MRRVHVRRLIVPVLLTLFALFFVKKSKNRQRRYSSLDHPWQYTPKTEKIVESHIDEPKPTTSPEPVPTGSLKKEDIPVVNLSELQKPYRLVLDDHIRRPFEMSEPDVSRDFEAWRISGKSMNVFLWESYQVVMIPVAKPPKDRNMQYQVFRQSIVRHVSIFFGDYQRAGGTGRRLFGIPECSEIGLGRDDNETNSKHLDSLAGSQGDIRFKTIPYYSEEQKGAFLTESDGAIQMVTKYFNVREKDKDEDKQTSVQRKKRLKKNKEKARESYFSELNALNKLCSPNIVHGICTVESKLQIVYPFLKGGDLVPLSEDKLGLRVDKPDGSFDVLNPDQTFLPRFSKQLITAVQQVHAAGMVHFDLKPENFVVAGPDRNFIRPVDSEDLQAYHLVLIDFGLSEVESKLTDECYKSGTEVTMAPEQVLCNAPAGYGTDWWGLAAGLWRVRCFWEPSIDEKIRDALLHSRDPQWGHVTLPPQPFFALAFQQLLDTMLKPSPTEREFDIDMSKLYNLPYLSQQ